MNMYNLACSIAEQAHKGQFDKGNHPYIEHPLYVSTLVDSIDEKIVALLHDVVLGCMVEMNCNLLTKVVFESKRR